MASIQCTCKSRGAHLLVCVVAAALIVSLGSCKKSDDSTLTTTNPATPAQGEATQRTFASPSDAGAAFVAACEVR